MKDDLIYRLIKRAAIRRSITNRKKGDSDRISDVLEEAAVALAEAHDISFAAVHNVVKMDLDNQPKPV